MKIKDLLKDAYRKDMTLEEIENALDGIDLPQDNSAEIEHLRTALSKSNSEAANYKKQLKDKMSEEEKAKAQEQEDRQKLQDAYDKLLRSSQITEYKSRLLSAGYEESLAADTAEAMFEGNMEKVFDNQKKHLDAYAKSIKADLLKSTPKPAAGTGTSTMTLENFRKMSPFERYQFAQNNAGEYKAMYDGAK